MSLLDYTETILEPLQELVLQDKLVDVPDIILKENSDIHIIAASINTAAFTIKPSPSANVQVKESFNTVIDFFDDDNNIIRTQAMDQVSKAISGTLETSYSTIINEIGATVEELRNIIEETYLKLLKRNKVDDIYEGSTEISEDDYTFLKWEKLRTPSRQSEIIETACNDADIRSSGLSILNLGYVTEKMKMSHQSSFKDITLPSEVVATIKGNLTERYTSETYGISQQRAERLFDVATSKRAFSTFTATLYKQLKSTDNVAVNTIFLIQLVNEFRTMMVKFKAIVGDNVNANAISAISDNVAELSSVLTAVQYYCLYNKEIRFKDRLVLTTDIINNQVYQDFVQQGHNIQDIHNYLKAKFSKVPVPVTGISIELISSTDVIDQLNFAAASNRANMKFLTSKYLIQAWELTLNEFMKTIMSDNLYDYEDDKGCVKRFAIFANAGASQFGGDIGKVDDVLYEVLLKSFYQDGSVVPTVYKYLRRNVYDLSKSAESISDDNVLEAEVGAAVHMLVDYLYDNLTVHKSPFKGHSPHPAVL